MPLNITYDNSSNRNSFKYLGMNISVVLREFRSEYIESVIVLTMVNEFVLNGTELECSIAPDLDIDIASVHLSTSGMSRFM